MARATLRGTRRRARQDVRSGVRSLPPGRGRVGRSPAALYARISPLPVGLPANTGGPGEGPGVRARAERAGVPTAADTPIASFPDSPARPEIQSILDRAASNVPSAPEAPRG